MFLVSGLNYEAGTVSGVTSDDGEFRYTPGAVVRFRIGGIVLGEARGEPLLGLLDLVPEKDADPAGPTVANLWRLLVSLDDDGNADNGIAIASRVREASADVTFDFQQRGSAFGGDPEVESAVEKLSAATRAGRRPLPDATTARLSLRTSLLRLVAGSYQGSFSGDDSGRWTLAINARGELAGKGVNEDGETFVSTGVVTLVRGALGSASGNTSVGGSFSATIAYSGHLTGKWKNEEYGFGGSLVGGRSD